MTTLKQLMGLGLLAGLLLAAAALTVRPVKACTEPVGGLPEYSATERLNAADVVFEGIVLEVITDPQTGTDTATVLVRYYIKGDPNSVSVLRVRRFGSSGLCLSPVQAGNVLIFYANGDATTGQLEAMYLSQFDAVAPVTEEITTELIAAAGQDPFVPLGAPQVTTEELLQMIGGQIQAATVVAEQTAFAIQQAATQAVSGPTQGSTPIRINATDLALGVGIAPSSTPTPFIPLDERYPTTQLGGGVALGIAVIGFGFLVLGLALGVVLGNRIANR